MPQTVQVPYLWLRKKLGLNHRGGVMEEAIKVRMHWPFIKNHSCRERNGEREKGEKGGDFQLLFQPWKERQTMIGRENWKNIERKERDRETFGIANLCFKGKRRERNWNANHPHNNKRLLFFNVWTPNFSQNLYFHSLFKYLIVFTTLPAMLWIQTLSIPEIVT